MSEEEAIPEIISEADKPTFKKWQCEISDLESKPASEENPWSVGKKLLLKCKGEILDEKFADNTKIKFAEESYAYTLNILKVKYSDYDNAQFVVTAYKVGDLRSGFFLADGKAKVEVEPLSWSVTSVVEKGTKPMPFGPMPPFKLSLPLWFWVVLIIAIFGIGFVAFKKIMKRIEIKRLLVLLS